MMSYEHRNSYGLHNDYKSNSRRNSFSDDQSGAKRRKRWPRRKPANRNESAVFKEPAVPPKRSPMISPSHSSHSRDNPFRKAPAQPYFDLRDMPEFIERPHTGAQWHWENYFDKCKAWQDKHKLAYYRSRCVALEFENQMLFEQINSLIQENCVFAAERGQVPSMRLLETSDKSGSQSEQDGQTPVKQEKKRSQEADKKKTNEEIKKKDEDMKKPGAKVPIVNKRKEELDLLYGKNSAVIHGLETSVLLNFNRNCDTHKPELWMAVALNPETVTG